MSFSLSVIGVSEAGFCHLLQGAGSESDLVLTVMSRGDLEEKPSGFRAANGYSANSVVFHFFLCSNHTGLICSG